MAGGPGGPEVGRVSVRVSPDTSKFGSQLKRDLTKRKMEELSKEGNAYPIKFEIDEVSLKRAVNSIRIPEITAKVEFDRKQVKEALERAIEKQATAKRVSLKVSFDRKQAKEALDAVVAGLTLDRKRVGVEVVGDAKGVEDAVRNIEKNAAEIPVRYEKPAGEDERLNTEVRQAVTKIGQTNPVNVPVKGDTTPIQRDLASAAALTKRFEQDAAIKKIEADKRDLEFKIAQAQAEVDELAARGAEIIIQGNVAPFQRELGKVDAAIARLNTQKATPEVALRITEFERRREQLLRQIAEIENRDVTIEAEAATAAAEAKLAALELASRRLDGKLIKLRAEVETDNDAAQRAATKAAGTFVGAFSDVAGKGVLGAVSALASTLGTVFSTLFNQLPDAMSTAFKSVGSSIDSVADSGKAGAGAIAGAIFGIGQAAISTGVAIFRLGAVSAALIVAGAAITQAWGGVSTAIAAVPGALALLGLPLATVMLGMDGIKKAAETLKPAFNDLKKAVSDTFEQGLKPAMEDIKGLLVAFKPDFVDMAKALSEVGNEMADFVSQSPQVDMMHNAMSNVKQTVKEMVPGMKDLTSALLGLMAQKEAMQVFSNTFNVLGREMRIAFDELRKTGQLQGALNGLRDVLGSLTQAFVDLIRNGIVAFNASAPGLKKFIDDLAGFFNRFDWDRLGKAVGDVFAGLGETLRKVPPETIEKITRAFEDLGKLFQDPKFQENLREMIELLPKAIALLGWLADSFASIGASVSIFIENLDRMITGFEDWYGRFEQVIRGDLGELPGVFLEALGLVTGIDVAGMLKPLTDKFQKWWDELPTDSWTKVFGANLGGALGEAIQSINPIQWLITLGDKIKGWFDGTAPLPEGWGNRLGLAMAAQLAVIAPGPILSTLTNKLYQWWVDLDVTSWFAGLPLKMQEAMGLALTTLIPGNLFAGLTNAIIAFWNALDVSTWFTQLPTKMQEAIGVSLTTLLPGNLFSALVLSIMEWWTALDVTSWFTGLPGKILNAFTLLMPTIAIGSLFGILTTNIMTWWTELDVTGWFSGLPSKIVGAFALLIPQIAIGSLFGALITNIQTYWRDMDLTTWFDSIPGKVVTTISNLLSAINPLAIFGNFFANIKGFFDGKDWTPELGAAGPNAQAAMEPGFQDAGDNVIVTLSHAISEGKATVINAVIDLAIDVINAAMSAFGIGSPSKVFKSIGGFIMDGWAIGLTQNGGQVVSAVDTVGNSVLRTAENAGGSIAEALAAGTESQNDAIARAAKAMVHDAEKYANRAADALAVTEPKVADWSSLEKSKTSTEGTPATPATAAPVVGQMTIQAGQGATADQIVDSALFRLRHYRRGLYA